MRTLEYTFWQDGEFFIGHLNNYPDYETQGHSKEELIENLKDLLVDLEANQIPFVRRVEELVLA
jgi:predicted RNase H-like HicB family nuclease